MEQDERIKFNFERTKFAVDILKHISTLATGSIVLIATLLDKIPKPISTPTYLSVALFGFVLSILSCFVFMFVVGIPGGWQHGEPGPILLTKFARWLEVSSLFVMISFGAGIVSLGFFAWYNVMATMSRP